MKTNNQKSRAENRQSARGGHRVFHFWSLVSGLSSHRGFTLLETVVSFGIFSVVIITTVGVIVSISSAEIKAGNLQKIQDNLRFAVESMTKEMRTGKNFSVFDGSPPAGRGISFRRADGSQVGYCLDAGALKKISGSGTNCAAASPVTGEEVTVDQALFYVIGHLPGSSDGQPRITVAIQARSRDPKFATSLRLQTTVVQRERDR